MGVIIIAVFWLLGLLMAWSMCVVAERADRRMEEIRHTTRTRISAGPPTPATRDAVVVLYAQWTDAMTTMPETGGTMNEHYLLKTIGGGLPLRPHPHPIRAAAHAPKPVASTGRAV